MSSKLGFEDLMSIAERNARKGEKKAQQNVFPTISKPKKLDPKQKKLSEGIQKFLEQKKEEERRKALADKAKRDHLEGLRNQDKKAKKRVGQMLRMTKSANKACMGDAVSCLNDSLAEQADQQPDEDDYGYVSAYAQQFHQKMLNNYKSIPVNKPVKKPIAPVPEARSLNKTRVGGSSRENSRMAEPTREEEYVPEAVTEKAAAKKRKATPTPTSFNDLLKLAQQKSQEPIVPKKPIVEKRDGPEFEFGRPMTAKEKASYLQEKSYRERIEKGLANFDNKANSPIQEEKAVNKSSSFKIPSKRAKVSQNTPPPPTKPTVNHVSKDSSASSNFSSKPHYPIAEASNMEPSSSFKEKRQSDPPFSQKREDRPLPSGSSGSRDAKARKEIESRIEKHSNYSPPNKQVQQLPKRTSTIAKPPPQRDFIEEKKKEARPHYSPQYAPKPKLQTRERQEERAPPHTSRDSSHSAAPPSAHRRPLLKPDKPSFKGRAVIDSDEEYDSEMDDFIDDSEVDPGNISDVIGQIFGYQRNKYMNEESDDECMESSLEQQMKEERRSLLIGIKEDKEEELREKADEERKKQRMLAMKKSIGKR